ncbi:hypothetical protein, partial [Pseudomonas rhodesiae]|uniref:hypothetical protein n=1 Tax=Pseudomonas rhodesiae TaxID=76760 RepID=UPI0032B2AAA6
FCGERACPALGCEAAPKPSASVCQIKTQCMKWGCFAAQRRASLLTTALYVSLYDLLRYLHICGEKNPRK